MEVWKDAVGLNGRFRVSNLGRILNVNYQRKHIEVIMKASPGVKGYPQFSATIGGKLCVFKVHRLVAIAFLENPNNYCDVNHINGIKTDNRVENLEWCDRSHNLKHAYRIGLKVATRGEESCRAKLTLEQVREIRRLDGSMSRAAIGRLFSTSRANVCDILNGKRWINIY